MASTTLPLRLGRSYVCPSCRQHSRNFSTTAGMRIIPPESPRYIKVPEPPQQDKAPKHRVKGTLPFPRNVMRDKTPEQVAKSIANATHKHSEDTPRNRFKARMTSLRKSNLLQGSTELYQRATAAKELKEARSIRNREAREAALNAPQSDHDRLTEASLDVSVQAELRRMAEGRSSDPDPDREERVAATRARLEALAREKALKRQDDLHTLYMNARTFIVDQKGLEAALEREFGESNDFPSDKPSMWGRLGPPPTSKDMLGSMAGVGKGGEDMKSGETLRNRVRRMAEGVTGGRMDL